MYTACWYLSIDAADVPSIRSKTSLKQVYIQILTQFSENNDFRLTQMKYKLKDNKIVASNVPFPGGFAAKILTKNVHRAAFFYGFTSWS